MATDNVQIFTNYVHERLIEYENNIASYYYSIFEEKDQTIDQLQKENEKLRYIIDELIDKHRVMGDAYVVNPIYADILNKHDAK